MSEENVNQPEQPEEIPQEEASETVNGDDAPPPPRRYFTRRNFFISFAAMTALVGAVLLIGFLAFRFGYLDNYIKTQFITKMDEIGITFSADVFRTTLSPMSLELGNAVFRDKVTGEPLFRIDSAKIGLTATNLYAWQLSRDFRVDSTDIDGAEVWIRFDEEGRSNFSNLDFIDEEAGYVNFNYTSARFSLKNGLVHFGDVQRAISAEAKNVAFTIEPENIAVSDELRRYVFDLTSTNSIVVYNNNPVEPVNVHLRGIAYREGAEITELRLTSPVATSNLNGRIEGWDPLRYNFNIESSVDLMQAATIFPNGVALRGTGNFRGTVSGEGEKYRIEGEIDSESLAADNIMLRALRVNATIEGEDSLYNASGRAIAEMLTFEDFRIDYPQLVGNVRGSGTNFRWVGELQAAAARTPAGTLSNLFIRDAVAEYEDKRLNANFGVVTARRFLSDDADIEGLTARNVRLSNFNDATDINLPNLQANSVKVEGAEMRGVSAGNIQIQNRGNLTTVGAGNLRADNIRTQDAQMSGVTANNIRLRSQGAQTNIEANNLRADNLQTRDARLRNLNADGINLSTRDGATDIRANNLQAAQVDASGARIGNLNASNVDARIRGNQTDVVAQNLRVARVETDAAILGSLNVAGVRLTIRNGRIEGRSNDINAGTVTLTRAAVPEGGTLENVQLGRPVFVLEPSGRYRASMDLSIGGGVLGSVRLGAARASVVATSDQIALNNLSADVMDGSLSGDAVIAMSNRNQSRVDAEFTNLDLGRLLALQGGRVIPVAGQTTGRVNLTFPGTNVRSASGTLTADFVASAGTEERGLVPINGNLALRATNGLFDIETANLNTERSALTATGRFDLEENNSNLNLALNSSDAGEIERLIRVLNISPELEEQLNTNQVTLAGNLRFEGNLTGNLENPTIDGRASLDSIAMRGRELGALTTDILVSPAEITLRNGRLQERDGGSLAFNINVPRVGENNISVQATLDRVNTGNLLAALPIGGYLPEGLRDFQGDTSGTINLTGLPDGINGEINLSSGGATVAGQRVDGFDARVTIQNSLAVIERFDARLAGGTLQARGNYQTNTGIFNFDLEGRNLQLAQILPMISRDESLPNIAGTVNLTARATGNANDFSTFDVNFDGTGQNVAINGNTLGTVSIVGNTTNQILTANLTATLGDQPQIIAATLNFGDPNLPFRAETNFNQTELAPYIALLSPPENVEVTGRATGRVYLEGNLYAPGADGRPRFTTENLRGEARFTQFSLLIGDTPFVATDPLAIRFNNDAVVIDSAEFTGGGSSVVVSGTKALSERAVNNLSIDGKVNLRILDVISRDTFFAGLADVAVRLTGTNAEARLNGTASVANASFSTFVGTERITLNRINGKLLFTSDQAQIENLTAYLGGGRITASGGALLRNLELQRLRVDLRGQNVTTPLSDGFVATADIEIGITSDRQPNNTYDTLIAGRIDARRAVYTRNIDLADIIGSRREGSLGAGTGGSESIFGSPRLNIAIEGRDALIIRNNIADVTASASLRIAGDLEDPLILGRITANTGTVFFRNDRYDVQRAVLEFPPQNQGAPFINLQAETEIRGYQIVVNMLGDLSNPEALSAVVRSNPALPQADVISLITTGNLANTGTGIPTLAQSGINTAAEILTDALINDPLRRATDRLFGLNRFEIDPVISGQRLNPTARLTVGRQINRNLLVTYSTNLSEDQNQILALEYRVSNRLSLVAQYEQRSLSNVTRNNNNFSFEIRLRKRF
jgi:translocation and assembly module TamB